MNADVIYLDFAKACDKIDHGILSYKLRNSGISVKIGRWIHKFLTGRTQRVSANGTLSGLVRALSSVPQGTVLGPILFLVLIADINKDTSQDTLVSSFADDTRVTRMIKNT